MSIELYRSHGYFVAKIDEERTRVPLVPFGDFHIGLPSFFEKGFLYTVEWIKENQGRWIGTGDMMEAGQRTSVGASVYEQVMKPDEQRKYLNEKLKPIAHLCLGLLKGNHEDRIYKTTGIDPMMLIAETLSIPYFRWEFFGIIIVSRSVTHRNGFTIYANHTYSGNKTSGLAFNWIEREVNKWLDDVDIVIKAHDHSKGCTSVESLGINKNPVGIYPKTRYLVLSGHFMHRAGSYIAQRAGEPKPPGTMVLWLDQHGTNVRKRCIPEYLPDEEVLWNLRDEECSMKVSHGYEGELEDMEEKENET